MRSSAVVALLRDARAFEPRLQPGEDRFLRDRRYFFLLDDALQQAQHAVVVLLLAGLKLHIVFRVISLIHIHKRIAVCTSHFRALRRSQLEHQLVQLLL